MDEKLAETLKLAEQLIEKVADNYTVGFETDTAAMAVTVNAAVMIYCANMVARAIYSTGPV